MGGPPWPQLLALRFLAEGQPAGTVR